LKLRIFLLSLLVLPIAYIVFDNLMLAELASSTLSDRQDFGFIMELPDSNISSALHLNLKSAIAVDNKTQEILYCHNADEVRPIASITKLLTAMVVLDNYRPDTVISISKEDAARSSRSLFRVGNKIRAKDLLHAALLQSDNRAARALARTAAGSYEDFTRLMNKKAEELGLENTKMLEPTGLDEGNLSTAADCARLVNAAMQLYPEIGRITSLKKYTFRLITPRKSIKLTNTNKMVFSKYKVLVGKTGYIIESDYCLTTILENDQGHRITVVVLGAPGPQTRFREARRLANYAFRQADQKRRLTAAVGCYTDSRK
jgi:D-alanyl-D-alanine endopeptidase (penicillin-binding protein 7)